MQIQQQETQAAANSVSTFYPAMPTTTYPTSTYSSAYDPPFLKSGVNNIPSPNLWMIWRITVRYVCTIYVKEPNWSF